MDTALDKARVTPSHHTVSSLAAAEAVLDRQQKESGTVVLDIGASTTNLVVFEDGEVQHVAVLPIGGIHMTNDLAIGLRTDLAIAEAVKLQHGSLKEAAKAHRTIRVRHDGREHQFDLADVYMILEARTEELFEYADKELKRIHKSGKLPGGAVIVGGVASLPGIAEFAKEVFALPARVGQLQAVGGLSDELTKEPFVTAVGLMWLDMLLGQHNDSGETGASALAGIGSMTKNIFKRFGRKG